MTLIINKKTITDVFNIWSILLADDKYYLWQAAYDHLGTIF